LAGLERLLVASVASELSAVHHAHAGLGLRGNSQAASQQDSASSFDSLLDGADSSPPPPAPAPRPAPPTSSAPPPAQQSAPEESADKPGQTPAADATQTPPESTDVSAGAQAGVTTGSDDRKGSGSVAAAALGPPAPITGKAGQPFIAAILDAAAPSDDAQAVGPIVPADPNGSVVAASEAASQDDLNATTGLPDRHDGKSGKSDGPDSAQAAAVPGDDSALTPIVVPVPQPVAFAVSAPTGAEGDDDGGEIARLAAAGGAARPSRPGTQPAGADAASADAAPSAPNDAGEEDGGPAPT